MLYNKILLVLFVLGFCYVNVKRKTLERNPQKVSLKHVNQVFCFCYRFPRACSSPAWPLERLQEGLWGLRWSSLRITTTTGLSLRSGVRLELTALPPAFMPWSVLLHAQVMSLCLDAREPGRKRVGERVLMLNWQGEEEEVQDTERERLNRNETEPLLYGTGFHCTCI